MTLLACIDFRPYILSFFGHVQQIVFSKWWEWDQELFWAGCELTTPVWAPQLNKWEHVPITRPRVLKPVLEDAQHCTFCLSPLSDTPPSGVLYEGDIQNVDMFENPCCTSQLNDYVLCWIELSSVCTSPCFQNSTLLSDQGPLLSWECRKSPDYCIFALNRQLWFATMLSAATFYAMGVNLNLIL